MGWDWQAIGAIASVMGVAGGIVSVIFLIYEVRRNTKAIEGATVQSLMSLEREIFTLLAEYADLFIRGSDDASRLPAQERFQFDKIVGAEMSLVYSAFVQFDRNLISQDVWEAYLNSVDRYMNRPGFADSWNTIRDGYPKPFLRAMDKRPPA